MPTPFPGMDPYLEQSGIWSQVHIQLIAKIQDFLAPQLRPHYIVDVDIATYLTLPPSNGTTETDFIGRPDDLILTKPATTPLPAPSEDGVAVATAPKIEPIVTELPIPEKVTHRYLEVRTREDGRVVTVIEILSPSNKAKGPGREDYKMKREKIFGSATSLVEIDLLRAGQPMPLNVDLKNNYRILVSRANTRPFADVYLFSMRDSIPDIPIPLLPDDAEPSLSLNHILHTLYDTIGLDLRIDYTQPPKLRLSAAEADWVADLMRKACVK